MTLVASTGPDGLYFSKFKGDPVGKAIVDQSMLLLLSITQKPFGQYLTMLMGTVWQDDDLEWRRLSWHWQERRCVRRRLPTPSPARERARLEKHRIDDENVGVASGPESVRGSSDWP